MTVRQLLQTCRDERKEIIILEEKRDTLRASLLPKAINPQKGKIQTSPSNTFDAVQSSIYDLNLVIDNHLTSMYRHEAAAFKFIRKLEDPRHRQMLMLYYLSFLEIRGRRHLYRWEHVAKEMGYSVENIYKLLDNIKWFLDAEIYGRESKK